MRTTFYIDGRHFEVLVTKLTRSADVLDSPHTVRALNGVLHRDVIGTYVNYSLEVEASQLSRSDYDDLFELLSSPEQFHEVVFPYGQQTHSFRAYCTKAADELESISEHGHRWGRLQFNFVAMAPARRPS